MRGQGSWLATMRHGQATISQWPQPFTCKRAKARPTPGEEEENPDADGTQMDAAQLRVLLHRGADLPEVHAAVERRAVAHTAWHWTKAFTTRVGAEVHATQLWDCTSLTWDPQFPVFVSP